MKRIINIVAVTILIWGITTSCEPKNKTEDVTITDTGIIIGCVTDFATGMHIQNANVQLRPSGETTLTGYDGMFEFQKLSPGRYSLSVSKAEYLDLNDDYIIDLSDGKTIRRDIQLQKQVASLLITDTDGNAISSLDFGSEESVISMSFNIFNNGTVNISCQITYTCPWIVSVSTLPDKIYSGQTVNVTVVIKRDALSAGQNTTYLHITSNNGNKDLVISAVGNSLPSVKMSHITKVGYEQATLTGEIISVGQPPYKEYGFVISESELPTIKESLQTIILTPSNPTASEFTSVIKELKPRKTYHVRAFATNNDGTAYSSPLKFSTKTPEEPVIATVAPFNIHETGAVLQGFVASIGEPSFTTKGFVISNTNSTPTIDNSDVKYISGNKKGVYTSVLTGISENSTFYVRAFAITPYDTIYFNTENFKTQIPYVAIGNIAIRLEDEKYIESDSYYDAGIWAFKMSHYDAEKKCNELVLGKYDDWRLPTIDELKLIYEHRNDIGVFKSEDYWSSTKNKDDENYEDSSWREGYVSIDFSSGQIKYSNPYAGWTYRVRAVRSLK